MADHAILEKNRVSMLSTTATEHHLPGVLNYGYPIYTTSDFPGYSNHCTPTAAVNVIWYWSHWGPVKRISLWTNDTDVFNKMRTYMGHTNTWGTPIGSISNGVKELAKNRGVKTPAVSQVGISQGVEPLWNHYVSYINLDCIFEIGIYDPGGYGEHSIVGIGYTNYSGQNRFYRVFNGWDKSASIMYNFTTKNSTISVQSAIDWR